MAASRLHLIMPAAGGVQRGFWLDELDVAAESDRHGW